VRTLPTRSRAVLDAEVHRRRFCWRCADDGDDVILDALPHLVALKAALDVPRDRP